MKVSVVITAFNEERKIEDCLKSVKKIANEIIFIDSSSTDKTSEIAKKYTDKIFVKPNNLMLNTNKNFGFSKAKSNWVLSIDSDERLEDGLIDEILNLDEESDIDGYYIPRKNIIFNKWIKNTGWYPDYQLRLFKKEKGKFDEEHVHEMLRVTGQTVKLQNHIRHLNYDSISHFLEKTISIYTISEAEAKLRDGYEFKFSDIYKMPVSEFTTRFFSNKGYKDGMHGLVLSLLMAFYHFVIFLRLWEKNNYKEKENSFMFFEEASSYSKKELKYWLANEKIENETNKIKKNVLKLKRKLSS